MFLSFQKTKQKKFPKKPFNREREWEETIRKSNRGGIPLSGRTDMQ